MIKDAHYCDYCDHYYHRTRKAKWALTACNVDDQPVAWPGRDTCESHLRKVLELHFAIDECTQVRVVKI